MPGRRRRKGQSRGIALAFAAALGAVALGLPALAQTAVPSPLGASLERAAQTLRALANRETALALQLNNRALAVTLARQAHKRAESTMAAIVIAGIAANPALSRDIVAAAVGAAPELRDSIVTEAMAAFPGFSGAILAGAGGPIAPRFDAVAEVAPRPQTAPVERVQRVSLDGGVEAISDPIEGFNRVVFAFNDGVDIFVLRPTATVYGFITPGVAKEAVQRFFLNLRGPVILVNDLLQLEINGAAITTGRLIVNTTIGIFGLFDVADFFGLEGHHADFGQTLHAFGLGPGPYLVLPLLGPSTARDAVGWSVDLLVDPLTYVLDTGAKIAVSASGAVVERERLLVPLEELREGSVDYYAALRSAYYQDRAIELNRGAPPSSSERDALFDAAE